MQFNPIIDDKPVKRLRIKLVRGYFPEDPDWPKNPLTGGIQKALAETVVELPLEEAKRLLKERTAELPDDFDPS